MIIWKKYYFKIPALLTGGLIIFILGWYSVSRILSINNPLIRHSFSQNLAESRTPEVGTLKVAAYNIAHARGGKFGATNWQYDIREELTEHLDKIAGQIKKEDPDIMVLNEADFSSAWSFHLNQARYIGKKCGYPYMLEQKNIDVSFPFYRFCFGNAILSKYPIRNERFTDFEPLSEIEDIFAGNHDAVYCEIESPFGILGVFAIHLEYRSEDVRVRCAKSLAEMCSGIKFPIIALGDFNSTPAGLPGSRLSERGENAMSFLLDNAKFISYLEKRTEPDDYTFPSESPKVLIDWILGKGVRKFSGSGNIKSGLSDHLMVVTMISLKE